MRYINIDKIVAGKFHHVDEVDRDKLNPYMRGWNDALDAVIAESAGAWIPIEKASPEIGQEIVVSVKGTVYVDWLDRDSEGSLRLYDSLVLFADVDAWMPLPKPYGGET